jgi:hypothetical protein
MQSINPCLEGEDKENEKECCNKIESDFIFNYVFLIVFHFSNISMKILLNYRLALLIR